MSSLTTSGNNLQLIDARKLAAKLQVSLRTLWRWRSSGQLIQPIRIGGVTRWNLADVEHWIAQGCLPPKQGV
jgi:predicted DNA-binding transcriptional regulator AlpA